MPQTIISSNTKEVKIGSDHPFVVIGERINPTGRKLLAEEMKAGNLERVREDAINQVTAGAQMLDVNAGVPLADEPKILADSIKLIQSITDAPLCIDSSIVEALKRGLEVYEGKALLNSVTGEEERLESVLPLVKKFGCAVIGISNDDTGISEDPDVRFDVAQRIVQRASDYGIPAEDVVVEQVAQGRHDLLVLVLGAQERGAVGVRKVAQHLRRNLGELGRAVDDRRRGAEHEPDGQLGVDPTIRKRAVDTV